jgi:NAD(P)-dependent dehydrogenase (short-subunit alcohol dehydrogenase family)
MSDESGRRVAVVTGASSGIGRAAAVALAAQGWHVIAHGRDAERTAQAEAIIRAAAAPSAKVDIVRADLSSLGEAARMARDIQGLTGQVHALLNNAGGVRDRMIITPDGNEATFAGNHLGHFLLTSRLLPQLRAAAAAGGPGAARVVSVSSTGHEVAPAIDWDDLQLMRSWVSGRAYCLAKLCNILFTRELARRVTPDGIVANAMHPGVVASNFVNHGDAQMQQYMATLDCAPPENAAGTLVWLAGAPETGRVSGHYFYNRAAIAPAPAALDDASARRLWQESEALVAKSGY